MRRKIHALRCIGITSCIYGIQCFVPPHWSQLPPLVDVADTDESYVLIRVQPNRCVVGEGKWHAVEAPSPFVQSLAVVHEVNANSAFFSRAYLPNSFSLKSRNVTSGKPPDWARKATLVALACASRVCA